MKTSRALPILSSLLLAFVVCIPAVHAETKFALKPFFMIGVIDGDLTTENVDSEFSIGWGNAFGKGNGALGLDFDIRAEDFNILSQVWYTTLSDTDTTVEGFTGFDNEQNFTSLFVTEVFGIALYRDNKDSFDLTFGGRFASVENELEVRTDKQYTFEDSKSWVDPVVGFNSVIELEEGLLFTFGGDYGGFDVSSAVTWQAMTSLNFAMTKKADICFGYRAMMHEFEEEEDGFKYDMLMHGPTVGLALNF